MNYKKLIIRETVILFISSVLTALSGYLLRVFLAKSLTVYDYGLFFGIFNFITSLIPFKDFGLASTVVRYLPEYNVKKETNKINNAIQFLFFFQLISYALLIAIGIIVAGPLLSSLFSDPRSFTIFLILLCSFSFSIFDSMFNATYLGFKKIYFFSIFQFTASLILMLSCYASKFFGITLESISIAYFIAFFLTTLCEFPFFIGLLPGIFKHRFYIDKNQITELFSFSIFQFLSASFKNLSNTISSLIMAWLSTIENVAYLNISMPTANIIKFLFKPISIVLLPISSELYTINDKSSKLLILFIYKYLLFIFIPIGIFFINFSEVIINSLFGVKYILASTSLSIFVFAYFFLSLYELNFSILLGHKKKNEALITPVIFLVCNICLNYILIKLYNLNGAAIAYLISSVTATVLTGYYLVKTDLLKTDFSLILKLTILGIILCIISTFLIDCFGIILGFVFVITFYLLAVFILRLITLEELKALLNRFN